VVALLLKVLVTRSPIKRRRRYWEAGEGTRREKKASRGTRRHHETPGGLARHQEASRDTRRPWKVQEASRDKHAELIEGQDGEGSASDRGERR
jgi:hypothetical protein